MLLDPLLAMLLSLLLELYLLKLLMVVLLVPHIDRGQLLLLADRAMYLPL